MKARIGITLIEMILAFAIMAMAAAAFFPAFNQGVAFTKEIRDYSILVNLAEMLVHDYSTQISKTTKASPLSIFEEDITQKVLDRCKNPVLDGMKKFRVSTTVRPSLLCENGGYEIIIKFDWETGGRGKTFSLATAKAAPDEP